MIDKRSIPKKTKIFLNNKEITRDHFISISKIENWSEKKITLILKLIKQGGYVYIGKDKYQFLSLEDDLEISSKIDTKTLFMPDGNK